MIKMFDKLNVIIIITVINFVINKLSLKIINFFNSLYQKESYRFNTLQNHD